VAEKVSMEVILAGGGGDGGWAETGEVVGKGSGKKCGACMLKEAAVTEVRGGECLEMNFQEARYRRRTEGNDPGKCCKEQSWWEGGGGAGEWGLRTGAPIRSPPWRR